jgi:hypothetical protein
LSDNGCDVWVDLLRNKWVQPHPEILLWATTSPDEQAGLSLLDELLEPCRGWASTHPEKLDSKLETTVNYTRYTSLLSRLLSVYNPVRLGRPDVARSVSRTAACRGLQFLKVLLEHGFGDEELYGRDEGSQARRVYHDPIAHSEDVAFGITDETTALHAAAGNAASVEFLLQRGGVPRVKDGWGRDAYELAKYLRSLPTRGASNEEANRCYDKAITVFERFGWHLAEGGGEGGRGRDGGGDEGGDKGKGKEEGDKGKGKEEEDKGKGNEGEGDGVRKSRGMKRSSQGERKSPRQVKKPTL